MVVVQFVASCIPAPQLSHGLQALLFGAAAKVTPSMQASGCHAPLVQALPAGHAEHSACDVMFSRAPKEPASHGNGCTLPSGHRCPSGHGSHAVAPGVLTKLPASQRRHSAIPSSGAVLPGRHGRHASALTCCVSGLCVPASHSWHALAAAWPSSGLKRPAGHAVKASSTVVPLGLGQ